VAVEGEDISGAGAFTMIHDIQTRTWANEMATGFIEEMSQEPLLHGDAEHRAWLADELRKHLYTLEALFIEAFEEGYNEAKDAVMKSL
jgi:hypothetical protein